MRTLQRVIAASALGLPLLLAGQGMVLASQPHNTDGSPHSKQEHNTDGSPQSKQDQKQSTKIGPIVVSGNKVSVNTKPVNLQNASITNTNTQEEGKN